jgi:YVTN family beta-propeller protein
MDTTLFQLRAATVMLGAAITAILSGAPRADEPGTSVLATPQFRRPAALALSRDGQRLFVANRRSGTLSVINTSILRLTAEFAIGRGLSDVAVLRDDHHLLAVDQGASALIRIESRDGDLRVSKRIPLPASPTTLAVAPDESAYAIASRDGRCLTFMALNGGNDEKTGENPRTVPLPFSPHSLCWVDADSLIASDAFGGKIAVVDAREARVRTTATFPCTTSAAWPSAPTGVRSSSPTRSSIGSGKAASRTCTGDRS